MKAHLAKCFAYIDELRVLMRVHKLGQHRLRRVERGGVGDPITLLVSHESRCPMAIQERNSAFTGPRQKYLLSLDDWVSTERITGAGGRQAHFVAHVGKTNRKIHLRFASPLARVEDRRHPTFLRHGTSEPSVTTAMSEAECSIDVGLARAARPDDHGDLSKVDRHVKKRAIPFDVEPADVHVVTVPLALGSAVLVALPFLGNHLLVQRRPWWWIVWPSHSGLGPQVRLTASSQSCFRRLPGGAPQALPRIEP